MIVLRALGYRQRHPAIVGCPIGSDEVTMYAKTAL
jgi:hypothetical protein